MTSLRHLALGCCVISALAGMLRLFWPENGLADELRNLPAGGSTVGYEAYRRELALTASVDAVREVLRGAGIDAAVSLQDGVCVITPVDIRDKAAIESLLAVNAGTLPWQFAGDAP